MEHCELLELVAKAANNGGDALQLAVELNISVFPPGSDGDFAVASIEDGVLSEDGDTWIQERVKDGDKLAATRRAIVRAATEIVKAKFNDLTPGDKNAG